MKKYKIVIIFIVIIGIIVCGYFISPILPKCEVAIGDLNGYAYCYRLNRFGVMEKLIIREDMDIDSLHRIGVSNLGSTLISQEKKMLSRKDKKELYHLINSIKENGSSTYYFPINGMITNIDMRIDDEKYWCPYHTADEPPFDEEFERSDMLALVEFLLKK